MKSLQRPGTDEDDLYDRVSSTRQVTTRHRLTAISHLVKAAYREYESVTSLVSLNSLFSADTHDSDLLRGNYEQLSSTGDRPRILARSSLCCHCGSSRSGQLDHYLPRSKFPEFSILSLNLIPCCSTCNGRKLEKYQRPDGGALFLHPYFDELPGDERFLDVAIEVSTAVIVEYSVVKSPSMTQEMYVTLASQFNHLNLGDQYFDEAIAYLGEQREAIADYFDDGGSTNVAEYLRRDAASQERTLGLNHWKPCLNRALSQDAAFCEAGFQLIL